MTNQFISQRTSVEGALKVANPEHSRAWTSRREEKQRRMEEIRPWMSGRILPRAKLLTALEHLIHPHDRVVLEGSNQKQADYLSRTLAAVSPVRIHDLHLIIAHMSRPEHLALFEEGIARRVDFSFAGPQSLRVAQLIEDGKLELGGIHAYMELYARLFVDLIPNVVLVCAEQADASGNLYTGANTEDTPVITEAAAFHDGIVVAQVNSIADKLQRIDIPASWVDVLVEADRPFAVEARFTRDPQEIHELHILMAMMVIRGVYERCRVTTVSHGISLNAAALELILPTYGNALGLKGKICRHWVVDPHPTLIPLIEEGWICSVQCAANERGMEEYMAARSDIFPVGPDGTVRSNRLVSMAAAQYSIDAFVGSTLQMDNAGNSSTVTYKWLTGFGSDPEMGHDPRGRRHSTEAWLKIASADDPIMRGHKIVVQMTETFRVKNQPAFVENLDAVEIGRRAGMAIAPVMIYGDDVTHIVTEEGIAYLYKTQGNEERRRAIAAVAGVSPVGLKAQPEETHALRTKGLVAYPEDVGVRRLEARRSLLAARTIEDLVTYSGGLYNPPPKFASW